MYPIDACALTGIKMCKTHIYFGFCWPTCDPARRLAEKSFRPDDMKISGTMSRGFTLPDIKVKFVTRGFIGPFTCRRATSPPVRLTQINAEGGALHYHCVVQTRESAMVRLFGIIYAMGGTTLAGSAVVAALVTGNDTLKPILIAAVLGALVALPLCWVVAKKIIAGAK